MTNWLFQGNPKKYPVLDHLLDGETAVDWSMTQHIDDVSVTDRVVLWVSGKRAGVYAIGQVAEEPFYGTKDEEWVESGQPGAGSYFCPLEWTDVRVEHPILRTDLLAAGGFEQARIIRQPFAGNPTKLTDEEWDLIQALK